jgi:hypothetical protein
MAHVERPIKDYGRKSDLIRRRDFRVTPTPILWHSENNNLIYQAFMVLQSGLVAVPLLAGMDKFVNLVGDWPQYVSPALPQMMNLSTTAFMYLVGIIEVVIALGVALAPRVFSWILMVWLGGIILNLLMLGQFYDVALRDFGLMMAAFALWRLSLIKEEVPVVVADDEFDFITPELAH